MDESQELIQEFLIESNENLSRLDQEFVELEKNPTDQALLSSVFRTIHTIKGTCGFLGFTILEGLTHHAENLLSQIREGERKLTPELTTLLLRAFDVVKEIIERIDDTGQEGDDPHDELRGALEAACDAPFAGAEGSTEAVQESPEPASEVASEGAEAALTPDPGVQQVPQQSPPSGAATQPVSKKGSKASQKSAQQGEKHKSHAATTIRVDVNLLDQLMNLAGELVLSRNQILQHTADDESTAVQAASQRLNLITTELQAAVMKTRMQPIGVVWNQLPRVVRDLSTSLGKKVELKMEGAETELDKTILEAIKDPLTHIVRNSCDHGIELPDVRLSAGKPAEGTLKMRAFHEGGQVNIEISDDGAGINIEKIKNRAIQQEMISSDLAEQMSNKELLNLIFRPGFSTADKVTNVSGRGVGMDVVRTNIEKIGGSIELQSEPDQGSTIRIKIPLTLAIIPALVVSCGKQRFAIPQVSLLELVRLDKDGAREEIEWIHGSPVYRLRGKLLTLVYLDKILGVEPDEEDQRDVSIVVLQADNQTFGLVVDSVHDTQEIVVKPLSNLLKGAKCYAGATIMGDGHVALIIDVSGVARMGGALSDIGTHAGLEQETHTQEASLQSILLFECGDRKNLGVPLSVVSRLEEFDRERVERSGNLNVVQYRDKVLPLISLGSVLGLGDIDPDQDKLQVIVFSTGDREVGVIVDRIAEVVQDSIEIRSPSSSSGILGSAVIAGRVTDFIDLQYVIESMDHSWFRDLQGGGVQDHETRVLIGDPSTFSRGILRNNLELRGYVVEEAESMEDVLRSLEREKFDVLLSDVDLAGGEPAQILDSIRDLPSRPDLPVIALCSGHGEGNSIDGFSASVPKYDREATLSSIERLAALTQAEAQEEVLV